MNRVTEFHNIMPIINVASVLEHGLLCHVEAKKLEHIDVYMEAVQEKRDKKQVPGGLLLHQYANIYFHARKQNWRQSYES